MKVWHAGPESATPTHRRRCVGVIGSLRAQLLIAVLFGSLIGGGFLAASAGGGEADRGAPVHSIMEQLRNGHTDGSGYDQDHR